MAWSPPWVTPSARPSKLLRPPATGPLLLDGDLQARRGEIIGLGGLAGHGQTERLRQILATAPNAAMVPGDRATDGVFPLWSIARNMSVRALATLRRGPFIDSAREATLAATWRDRLGLVTPDVDNPILSLSGGNQQKALFARALASDADLILMDDPMRGVDIGTKRDVYALIAAEARNGRTFLWYSTEFDELAQCDRLAIFRDSRITGQLPAPEITEEAVLTLSFADTPSPSASTAPSPAGRGPG